MERRLKAMTDEGQFLMLTGGSGIKEQHTLGKITTFWHSSITETNAAEAHKMTTEASYDKQPNLGANNYRFLTDYDWIFGQMRKNKSQMIWETWYNLIVYLYWPAINFYMLGHIKLPFWSALSTVIWVKDLFA